VCRSCKKRHGIAVRRNWFSSSCWSPTAQEAA